ncbi:hypothetical protein PUN28_001724 [Cardiocondyla obscurior]|uniref:Uncharacterized protein n=1 Tax=Cardiocondyla obscurior TaxID=286306 RepID=A0AAW2GQY1_9HYME
MRFVLNKYLHNVEIVNVTETEKKISMNLYTRKLIKNLIDLVYIISIYKIFFTIYMSVKHNSRGALILKFCLTAYGRERYQLLSGFSQCVERNSNLFIFVIMNTDLRDIKINAHYMYTYT